MRRHKAFLAGTLLLLWANYVAAASVWPEPYFVEAEDKHLNVTWRPTGYARQGGAAIWEGTEGEVELMRLSFQPEGDDEPQIAYTGARGLGLQLKRDDNPLRPLYLIATEPGDYEGGIERFFISVSSPVVSRSGSVTIYLENVNDNPPVISSPAECAVEELFEGETDCIFVVEDADGGACYAEMTVDDDHFSFDLNTTQSLGCKTATFVLIVAKELDFETYRLHSLKITATDRGIIGPGPDDWIYPREGTQEQTVSFVVDVIDVPDEPPRWEVIVPSHTVDEKTEWSLELRAVDGDYGLNWRIVYSLKFAEGDIDAEKYFNINEDSGILTGEAINRDELQREIFKFEVVATEVPDRTYEALFVTSDIVVMINDLNDNFPEIEPKNVKYIDFPEEHAFTDKNFTVSDPDLGDHGTFHLELEDNKWSSNFMLIPPSGYQKTELTITAIDPSKLDYEDPEWRNIELTIVATEEADKSHFTEAILRIELLDLIDEPPEFEKEEYTVSIEENQPEGILVVHTVAHDPDEQDVITFTLRNPYMEIDDEGHITTINDNAFDYERQTEILLQVVAEDTAGFRAFCQVTINVIDLNDEPPTLIMPYERHEIEEHADEGERASPDIKATDPDTEADLVFEIDWEDSAAYKQGVEIKDKSLFENSVKLVKTKKDGAMWHTHLVVANSFEFDWEVFDTLKLQISVIDKGTHPDYLHNEKSSAILTVILDDINDCVPQFTEETLRQNFTVTENTLPDRILGSIIATDNDSAPFSQIRYSIEPTEPDGLVKEKDIPRIVIDEETGVLKTTKTKIDCDEWQTLVFEYEVTATDGTHTNYTTIYLYIEDLNDESPIVTEPESLIIEHSFEEHSPGPQRVGCISGDDIDYTVEFKTITYYIEGAAADLFEMEEEECLPSIECCLRAIDGTVLDREKQDTHVIEVLMRDNFKDRIRYDSNEGPKTTVTLTLIDINDNPPVFVNDGATFPHFESKLPDDKKLFDAEVSDEDIGLNGDTYCEEIPRVTCQPERPPETIKGVFEVKTNGPICSVYATKELRGLWGIYTFTLKAHDRGVPSLSSEGVYTVIVNNENLNRPEITYPLEGRNILIGRDQTLNSLKPLKDIYGNDVADFKAIDKDDPDTPNGQVSFEMTGDENVFYLYRTSELNTEILQMRNIPPADKREFILTLVATDRGEPSLPSTAVNFNIYVLNLGSTPEFYEVEDPTNVKFSENTTGLEETVTLPEARNLDEEYLETQRPIFYYIIEGDTTLFELDRETRNLTLKKMLDYEEEKVHHLKILATHDGTPPVSGGNYGSASLDIVVEVEDINDMPPRFTQPLFPGTFSVDQDEGQKVAELKAEDPDTDDEITYEMVPGTITATSTSLEQFVNVNPLRVDPKTGIVTLNFSPGNRELDGYFSFQAVAYDLMGDVDGHRDYATVNIYVVSTAHQVQFHFYNPVGVVEAKQDEMADEFTRVLGYTCTVEKVQRAESSGDEIDTSEVLTHFIDNDHSPVPRGVIENKFIEPDTYSTLYTSMQELSLSFRGFRPNIPIVEESGYMTIVLAAVCAVLAVLVVVFSLAFVVRTRTLNQRLDKLTSKKFGSQDSGLNRESLTMPGTNRHALEGSNPVWNHEIDADFDNESQGSGDSDLIGIEDSPEFNEAGGVDNKAFEAQQSTNPYVMPTSPPPVYDIAAPRRASINPLAAAAAAEGVFADPEPLSFEDVGMPRRISLNPLAGGLDGDLDGDLDSVEVDEDPAPGNSNFSFQRPREPSTEL